jgi:CDP-2,3-bis-(O-geranylgeranyl)-sn-glycerol synthase
MGFGALAGDSIKSFFKRRLGFAPGKAWVPFDQLDFIVGGLTLTSLYVFPGWAAVSVLLLLTPALHYLTNWTAYKIGLKDVPW